MLLVGCEAKEASKTETDKAEEAYAQKTSSFWSISVISGVSGTPLDKTEVIRFSERDRRGSLAYDIKSDYLFDIDAGEYANKELNYLCSVLINGDKVEVSGDILNWAKTKKMTDHQLAALNLV
jgi:hypothetical protein